MTPGDAAKVLAKAQAFDRRTVGQVDVRAWHEALYDLDLADALQAITRHYRDSREWIMPSDVRRHAIEIQRERRRLEREQQAAAAEVEERAAIADGTIRNRSAEVAALIAQLRDKLPDVPRDILRRPEVVEWERQRERAHRPYNAPNPDYDPAVHGKLAGLDNAPLRSSNPKGRS